jgi:hypothetical protein
MVLRHFGNAAVQQTDVVNRFLGPPSPCIVPASDVCDQPAPIDKIAAIFAAWGVNSNYVDGTIPFSGAQPSLTTEVDAQRPVEVGLSYSGGSGHVALVVGYAQDAVGPMLYVNDPAYGPGFVYSANLVQAYGLGSWNWTWVNIH